MNYETYEVNVYENGDTFWFQNGKRHRLNGPAIEDANGTKYYFQNGKRHRLDGPAIEYADGAKYYYIEDDHYLKEDFNKKIKLMKNPSCSGKIVEIEGRKYKLEEVK